MQSLNYVDGGIPCCQSSHKIPPFQVHIQLSVFYYRPRRSCGQGNIFTPVCHSVHRGGSASVHAGIPPRADAPRSRHPREQTPPREQTHPLGADPPGSRHPPESRLQHTVYERPVRILLECILVTEL